MTAKLLDREPLTTRKTVTTNEHRIYHLFIVLRKMYSMYNLVHSFALIIFCIKNMTIYRFSKYPLVYIYILHRFGRFPLHTCSPDELKESREVFSDNNQIRKCLQKQSTKITTPAEIRTGTGDDPGSSYHQTRALCSGLEYRSGRSLYLSCDKEKKKFFF